MSLVLISVWPCCTPGPGVPAHDALRLTVDTYEGRKAMASDATLMKLIRLLQHSVYVSEVIY